MMNNEDWNRLLIKSIALGNYRIHLLYDDDPIHGDVENVEVGKENIKLTVMPHFFKVVRGKGNIEIKSETLEKYLFNEGFYDFLYVLLCEVNQAVANHDSYSVATRIKEMSMEEKLALTIDLQELYQDVWARFSKELITEPWLDEDNL